MRRRQTQMQSWRTLLLRVTGHLSERNNASRGSALLTHEDEKKVVAGTRQEGQIYLTEINCGTECCEATLPIQSLSGFHKLDSAHREQYHS